MHPGFIINLSHILPTCINFSHQWLSYISYEYKSSLQPVMKTWGDLSLQFETKSRLTI